MAKLRIAVVLVALGLIAVAASCASGSQPRTGIAGSVRDWGAFGGTAPATDVQVECRNAATGTPVASTQTKRNGEFFLAVPAGRYQVAYASGSRPVWVNVEVADGKVTTIAPFVGRRGALQPSPPTERLRSMLQPEASALGVKKHTAFLEVTGTTQAGAAKLFGTSADLPATTQVWVCILTGDVSGLSSTTAARDLSRGGFVAYEFVPGTLERLATRSSPKKWRLLDWSNPDAWGGGTGSSLW